MKYFRFQSVYISFLLLYLVFETNLKHYYTISKFNEKSFLEGYNKNTIKLKVFFLTLAIFSVKLVFCLFVDVEEHINSAQFYKLPMGHLIESSTNSFHIQMLYTLLLKAIDASNIKKLFYHCMHFN